MESGSLSKSVEVPFLHEHASTSAAATRKVTLSVQWHLCSDLKLTLLATGFSACGCNKPCFRCKWDRTAPASAGETRTQQGTQEAAEVASRCTIPVMNATKRLQQATAARKAEVAAGGAQGVSPATQQEILQAKSAREEVVEEARRYLQGLSAEHPVIVRMNDAMMIQELKQPLPNRHYEEVTPSADAAEVVNKLNILQYNLKSSYQDLQFAEQLLMDAQQTHSTAAPSSAAALATKQECDVYEAQLRVDTGTQKLYVCLRLSIHPGWVSGNLGCHGIPSNAF